MYICDLFFVKYSFIPINTHFEKVNDGFYEVNGDSTGQPATLSHFFALLLHIFFIMEARKPMFTFLS